MASSVNNNALEITPSRKRKRELDCQYKIAEGLSNEGFSITSTTKKETKSFLERFTQTKKTINAEKENNYAGGMEVKSISELATAVSVNNDLSENPYEVVRKPPKKKKKDIFNEEVKGFINPALNLEIPDKKFNPFEVKRILPKDPKESNTNCFVNPGLNIRAEDNILNPYEVSRTKVVENQSNGIENPAMEMPRMWTLGIPFTPNIGCRIDFNNIQLDTLTPTNPRVTVLKSQTKDNFQHSLSVISEETVDIGKELDCYQLELENSINEAKLMKKVSDDFIEKINEETKDAANISGIHILVDDNKDNEPKTPIIDVTKNEIRENMNKSDKNIEEIKLNTSTELDIINKSEIKDDMISNKSVDSFDDDIDFKAPTPFVRSYRKPTGPQPPQRSGETAKVLETNKKSSNNLVANVIRRSIRKLMHPNGKSDNMAPKSQTKNDKSSQNTQTQPTNHYIFETLRHSLRRKPNKQVTTSTETISENDEDSIISDTKDITLTERQIFRSNTEELIVEKKISFRSSLRKSTRGMKNHVMKSVFKKNVEEYEFKQ